MQSGYSRPLNHLSGLRPQKQSFFPVETEVLPFDNESNTIYDLSPFASLARKLVLLIILLHLPSKVLVYELFLAPLLFMWLFTVSLFHSLE